MNYSKNFFAHTGAIFTFALALGCDPATPFDPSEDSEKSSKEDDGDEGEGSDKDEGEDSQGSGDDDGDIDSSKLDRSESCILEEDPDKCGYPGGPYGTKVGKRVENFEIRDCEGEAVEFAQFFQTADGKLPYKMLWVNFSAGWCEPCIKETTHFGELREKFGDEGFEIVQVLFQDPSSSPATPAFCKQWQQGRSAVSKYDWDEATWAVWIDPTEEVRSRYLAGSATQAPFNMFVDANGNIRWVGTGEPPPAKTLYPIIEKILNDPYGD